RGEAWLVDVTNPANPTFVSSFGIRKDLRMDPVSGQGCDVLSFGHGVNPSADGRRLFVSYLDAGFIALHVSRPASPSFLGTTPYARDQEGTGHSTSYDDARQLLFAADEDFCKTEPGIVPGWGFLRVFDASRPPAMTQIGEYHTPNSFGLADPGAGDFPIHNPL